MCQILLCFVRGYSLNFRDDAFLTRVFSVGVAELLWVGIEPPGAVGLVPFLGSEVIIPAFRISKFIKDVLFVFTISILFCSSLDNFLSLLVT